MKKINTNFLRRIKIYILTAIMLTMSFAPTAIFAAGQLKASAADVSGKPGENVKISVKIDENPGIVGLSMSVEYDGGALELTKYEFGATFSGMSKTASDNISEIPFAVEWINMDPEKLAELEKKDNETDEEYNARMQGPNGIMLLLSMKQDSSTGSIIDLNFNIKSGAASGKEKVNIEFTPLYSIDDESESKVKITSVINIGGEETTEETTKEETTAEETTEAVTTEEVTTEEVTTKEETTAAEDTTKPEPSEPAVQEPHTDENEPDDPALAMPGFSDVNASDWFYDYVGYVSSRGIIMGVSDTEFAPNTSTTRAMFVTVLGRMSGIDVEYFNTDSGFYDVEDGSWYLPYVKWAAENGIVLGYDDGSFCPNALITREQMCVMLVRYIKFIGHSINATVNTFADSIDISDWAYDAVSVASSYGLVTGKGENRFDPKADATRAEIAVIIKRFNDKFN